MVDEKQKPHAIFIPYPLQGHVIPSVHLATKLAATGFTITFLNTHFIHQQITNSSKSNGCDEDIFAGARNSGLDIRYATISDGFPVGFDRSLNHDRFMEGILHVLSAHVDEFLEGLVKKSNNDSNGSNPKVTVLIADTFYVWTSMIAKKYGLVNVSFWTEPALVLDLYFHLDLLKKHGHFDSQDNNREDTIDYIPGVRAIEPKDVMSYLQPSVKDTTTVSHRIISNAFKDVKNVDFILINTVEELEKECISALGQNKPTYAIGPIFSTGFINDKVPTSLWAESDCTQWLDTKPVGSVLYVSFGSYAHTSKEVIHAIAHGLLASEVNFIWVVRPDIVSSDDPNPLPDGFKEKASGKGLVVTWCSQTRVLSHKSIGGFLTHCGWNSILESTWCAVPMLCFPLLTDQFTNRKLVVDDWKIGINLCDDKVVKEGEVSEKINRLMRGKSAEELKENTKKVSKSLEGAWVKDGSSQRNFDQFNESIRIKLGQKN